MCSVFVVDVYRFIMLITANSICSYLTAFIIVTSDVLISFFNILFAHDDLQLEATTEVRAEVASEELSLLDFSNFSP